jgi:hypothetical protein
MHCLNCGKGRDQHIPAQTTDGASADVCPTSTYVEADAVVEPEPPPVADQAE